MSPKPLLGLQANYIRLRSHLALDFSNFSKSFINVSAIGLKSLSLLVELIGMGIATASFHTLGTCCTFMGPFKIRSQYETRAQLVSSGPKGAMFFLRSFGQWKGFDCHFVTQFLGQNLKVGGNCWRDLFIPWWKKLHSLTYIFAILKHILLISNQLLGSRLQKWREEERQFTGFHDWLREGEKICTVTKMFNSLQITELGQENAAFFLYFLHYNSWKPQKCLKATMKRLMLDKLHVWHILDSIKYRCLNCQS